MRSEVIKGCVPTSCAIVGIVFLAASAIAGLETVEGNERGLWNIDKMSVIVTTVDEVKAQPEHEFHYSVTLRPLATLSGEFDCGACPTIQVPLYAGGVGTAVREAPKPKTTVIAVIEPKQDGDGYVIAVQICRFMPGESPVAMVEGLNDPKVVETLKKIQTARAKKPSE